MKQDLKDFFNGKVLWLSMEGMEPELPYFNICDDELQTWNYRKVLSLDDLDDDYIKLDEDFNEIVIDATADNVDEWFDLFVGKVIFYIFDNEVPGSAEIQEVLDADRDGDDIAAILRDEDGGLVAECEVKLVDIL